MKKLYGLIGYPLEHSFSPAYFQKKFDRLGLSDHEYKLFSLEQIHAFPGLIESETFFGLNVTIPYKESIIPFLDGLDDDARAVGAVNTIRFHHQKVYGYNTDIWGFEMSLLPVLYELESKNPAALVLGSGGASKAVCFVLQKLKIPFTLVSRDKDKGMTYEEIDKSVIEGHGLIINTTPAGMYPDVESCPPLPYKYIKKTHFLFDLVYNPKKTVFLTKGIQHQGQGKNGLEMLIFQAEKSWEIWNRN